MSFSGFSSSSGSNSSSFGRRKSQNTTPAFGSASTIGSQPTVDWQKTTSSPVDSKDNAEQFPVNPHKATKVKAKDPKDLASQDVSEECIRTAQVDLDFFRPKARLHVAKQKPLQDRDTKSDKGSDVAQDKSDSATQQQVKSPESIEVAPFRVLDLPAELRLWIYRDALVPTGFHRWGHAREDQGRTPLCAWGLPATCRQVRNEIGDILYAENTIYVDADNVYNSVMPVISSHNFSSETWPLLQHIVLTLNVADHDDTAARTLWFCRCDWRQLQQLTGLKSIRIMVIYPENVIEENDTFEMMLAQVIQRVPAGCTVKFGPSSAEDVGHVFDWAANSVKDDHREYYRLGEIMVVDVKALEEAAANSMSSKGDINGSKVDFRWKKKG